MKELPELNTIKDALLNTYLTKEVCDIGRNEVKRAKTIGELIDVYKYYQTTLVGELFVPVTFFRTYMTDYWHELEQKGIYLDRKDFTLVNPKQHDILLLGDCFLRIVKDKKDFNRIVALHDSKVRVMLMGFSLCEVNIADESNVEVQYINEHAQLVIKSKKEIIKLPRKRA